jgi:serine/threonine-protein kinase HipA
MLMPDSRDRHVLFATSRENDFVISNLDLTLKLAQTSNIDTVKHGMLYHKNDGFVFWYRKPNFYRSTVFKVESIQDFLFENTDSFEQVISIIDNSCTFPSYEKLKLLKFILFSFLIGNDTIHGEDISLIHYKDKTEIAPFNKAYNYAIYKDSSGANEILFLNKKINLCNGESAFTFATKQLNITPKAFQQIMTELDSIYIKWLKLIEISFMDNQVKKEYLTLLRHRRKCFFKY